MKAKRWTVDIFIDEGEGHTNARARLNTGVEPHLTGFGRAKLNPDDVDVPEIGDELAAARALIELGNRLLATAARDIESITKEPAHLHS